jgi:hypothetical protein
VLEGQWGTDDDELSRLLVEESDDEAEGSSPRAGARGRPGGATGGPADALDPR